MADPEFIGNPIPPSDYDNPQAAVMFASRISDEAEAALVYIAREITQHNQFTPEGRALALAFFRTTQFKKLMVDINRKKAQLQETGLPDQEIQWSLFKLARGRIHDWTSFLLADHLESSGDAGNFVMTPNATFFLAFYLFRDDNSVPQTMLPEGFIARGVPDDETLYISGLYRYPHVKNDWPDAEIDYSAIKAQWWQQWAGRPLSLNGRLFTGSSKTNVTQVEIADDLQIKYLVPLGFAIPQGLDCHQYPLTLDQVNYAAHKLLDTVH